MVALKLGTRGSQLALFQANTTASLLKTHAGIEHYVDLAAAYRSGRMGAGEAR